MLDAGIRLAARDGLDHFTITAIVNETAIARGTIYAYFGDAMGMAASVWNRLGASWLNDVLATGWSVLDGNLDRALVEMMAIAHREPQLMEVIQPDIEELWNQSTDEVLRLRKTWTLAGIIGSILVSPIDPDNSLTRTMTQSLSNYSHRDHATSRIDADHEWSALGPPSSPLRHIGQSISDRLMIASIEIVAAAGFARASTLRIARRARLTPGAVTPRFDELLDLHDMALSAASNEVVSSNLKNLRDLPTDMHPADLNAILVTPALGEERRLWRTYRNEMLIAAHSNSRVAEIVRRSTRTSDDALGTFVRKMAGEAMITPAITFNRVFTAGLAVLCDLGLPIGELDHRPIVRWLYDKFA